MRKATLIALRLIVLATASSALTLEAGVARADPAPPPITTPPAASATRPPAEAIVDVVEPIEPCSDWSLQSTYGDTWPTDSTWWEYTCRFHGISEPEADVRIDYYYWDSTQAKSVYYGQRFLTWDWWYGSGFCLYWWNQATNQWYGPYGCAESTTPPTASLTVSCSWLSCSFDASASSDSDGTIQGYSWDFGDGATFGSDTSAATHTYPAAGTYTVRLEVIDDAGAFDNVAQAVTVAAPPNAPPTASFTLACSGLSCSFDGASSADSDGTITTYGWTFGDGSSGNGVNAQHVYTQSGSYPVTLTVTDNADATGADTQTVTVVAPPNAPPTASSTVSCSGLSCSFDGAGSADSDGAITTYRWNFGDGTSGNGVSIEHVYAQLGSYPVTLTVTDNAGATTTTAKAVTLIGLTARGYKVRGVEKVDLSWNESGASFDVYRNGAKIATVAGSGYTDIIGKSGPGSYTYQVCQATTAICSNQVTVTS
ncbi:PKD repeat-containing protein [Micromonospora rhizosphaerae]|uniref:PKD repeat-containing protein n=1 Tax=Micromonospora rhizosphaerae TaxID=568872 RepID=A0A1C6T0E5_9ACTN|nr:PKD domain-containing protein [Micromonospora rhizosphaerae]SCL35191.1 PKD repeat-containing protein [Micromonospora rhizosphaerae]